MADRKPYPSDVTDEEWAFIAPYLVLMKEEAPQRESPLREMFNVLRWMVRAGASWRMMPNSFPPWHAVYDQTQRWIRAGVFEKIVHDLRVLLRLLEGRKGQPTAAVLDSRIIQGSVESGERAGYDGYKKRKGSKVHAAVDTLATCLLFMSLPQTNRTARKSESLPRLYRSYRRERGGGLCRPGLHRRRAR